MISLNEWAETVQPEWSPKPEDGVFLYRERNQRWILAWANPSTSAFFDQGLYRKVVKAKAIERYKAHFYAEMVHEVDGTMYVGFTRDEAYGVRSHPLR